VSSVPRHSEEELRQQWAFLDALVDRQAASLKSGIQDPEEDDLAAPMVAADTNYLEEISTLTQRVTTLEDERTTLLRRIDLSEEARMAAESARAAAEAARLAAERALAEERSETPKTMPPKSRRKTWWQRIRE
jgi:septal ring factor EnvC (AmiA/AmiB activator)